MQVIKINRHVTAFYYGGDTGQPDTSTHPADSKDDWVHGPCLSLGVACYAVHNGGNAIIFDTLCSPEQAAEIKLYLEAQGTTKFIVVVSHWHLHHIGGNALYKDHNIVGTRKTREHLIRQKREIETGTSSWGPPPIEAVVAPDIVFDCEISIFLDDLEVRLHTEYIHSDDCLCAYLPAYKLLLAGDMLEDTIPFISDPHSLPEQLGNFGFLRALDIERILPNHCRLKALLHGGYSRALIESSAYYLSRLDQTISKNPEVTVPDIRTLMQPYLDKGVISYWPPYERIHRDNINKLKKFYRKQR